MHATISVSPGELLDKISILEIKKERITDDEKLKNINHELNTFIISFNGLNIVNDKITELSKQLKRVNIVIWDIEDNIRECERKKDFGATFIALARGVYKNNDERARLKREINNLLDAEIVEEKSYTEY